MKTILLFLLFGFIISCENSYDVKKKAEPLSQASPPARVELLTEVKSEPIPYRYQVVLRWQAVTPKDFALIVSRENHTQGLVHVATLVAEAQAFEDNNVIPGETYRYYLSRKLPESLERLSQSDVTIPTDLVLSGTRALPNLDQADRLFLQSNSNLYTNNFPTVLHLKELYSDNSILRIFPEGAQAPQGLSGNWAQPLVIYAKKATGKLRIFSTGQHGGDGIKGTHGEAGGPGTPGTSGEMELFPQFQKKYFEEILQQLNTQLPPYDPNWKYLYSCSRAPSAGGPGKTGGPGGSGGNGGNGGRSAVIYLRVEQPKHFEVEVIPLPGLGGHGGTGGDGGKGGPGGRPGPEDPHHVCPSANAGPVGDPGRSGSTGLEGAMGEEAPYCLELGESQFGKCSEAKAELGISNESTP